MQVAGLGVSGTRSNPYTLTEVFEGTLNPKLERCRQPKHQDIETTVSPFGEIEQPTLDSGAGNYKPPWIQNENNMLTNLLR